MNSTMSLQENSTEKPLSMEKEVVNDTGPSVVSLDEEFIEYKISIYILTYVTVPVAVWGWIGNFLSFRYVYAIFFSFINLDYTQQIKISHCQFFGCFH